MPLWAAVAIVAAAFGVRYWVRGVLFERTDILVLALFAVVIAVVWYVRRWTGSAEADQSHENGDLGDEPPGAA